MTLQTETIFDPKDRGSSLRDYNFTIRIPASAVAGERYVTPILSGCTLLTLDGSAVVDPLDLEMSVDGTIWRACSPASITGFSGQITVDLTGQKFFRATMQAGYVAGGTISGRVYHGDVAGAGGGGGGGTEYADGAARGTATGSLMMVDDGTNIQAVKGDSNGRLSVNLNDALWAGPNGASSLTRTLQVGGSDGTDLRTIAVTTQGVVKVDGSATTQPVSGNVGVQNGGNIAAVKAGSTAAATTDPALVVSLNPLSASPPQLYGAVTFTGTTSTTLFSSDLGYSYVRARVTSGGSNIAFEGTVDGSVWITLYGDRNTSSIIPDLGVASNLGSYTWLFNITGYKQVRLRCSSYSNSTTVNWVASSAPLAYPYTLSVSYDPNSGIYGSPISSSGSSFGNLTSGNFTTSAQYVQLRAEASSWFHASGSAVVAANATDVVTLVGNATRVMKVLSATVWSTQTTAGSNVWTWLKRGTANSGGTSTQATIVPVDTSMTVASGTNAFYTANPASLGTSAGNVEVFPLYAHSPGGSGCDKAVFDFTSGGRNPAGIALRGVTQCLALNFGGAATPAGLTVYVKFEWGEY